MEEGCQEGAQKRREDEGSEERRIRDQIIKEVIAGTQKKAIDEGTEDKTKRTGGQSLMQSWDCSQIENEEEEESWQERDQMAALWDEERKLEEILEQRRMEGSSLRLEAMRNVLEIVVHERMSQGIGVKGFEEKNKVSGWSIEK